VRGLASVLILSGRCAGSLPSSYREDNNGAALAQPVAGSAAPDGIVLLGVVLGS
jgi:hypothetical protein